MYLTKRFLIIPLYFMLVNLFRILLQYLDHAEFFLWCRDCKEIDSNDSTFDYIVVGCGSAGSVVARRLAENKNVKILMLEAGKHTNALLHVPSVGLLLQKTLFDWQYATVPQTTSCFALDNHVSHWPAGKIVGGTSMLNNMIYVRGHSEDFEEWFKDKLDYNYTTDVLPYFEKLENDLEEDERSSIYISDLIFSSKLPKFILDAARALGFSTSVDTINCTKGFGMPKVNIHKGQRWTTSHHLQNMEEPNVFLHTRRVVEKILFHNDFEAYAVKYTYLDKSYYVRASKGIILSAGVIGTPKLLLISGIGPEEHLDKLNITTKVNLPVGENLQDHITTGFDLILLNQTLGIGIEQMLSPFSVFEYFWNGTGPFTTGGCELLAFIDTKSSDYKESSRRPDLQFMVMPLGINEDNGVHLRRLMGISDYTWNNYFAFLNETKSMTILPVLLHPKSRGTVRLRDKDFNSMPIIDPKYLSNKNDVEILLKSIDLIKRLINTNSMQKLGARLNSNQFPGCENYEFDSKNYWECYIRHLTLTSYHPVGTCKMGGERDSTSVVNFDFQVKGTNNLFVVDASVMPSLPSGNINGAVIMLAEMASDVIKYRDFLSQGGCNVKEIFITKDFC